MEGRIDANAPLKYATIQIFPSKNRYEVFVCGDDEVEKLAVGPLEELLPHLSGVNNLYTKGSNTILKLHVSEELADAAWFTKLTLNRFLIIVGSPDFMNTSKVVEGEISQLEEARKFHLSLYAQDQQDADQFGSMETGECNVSETAQIPKADVKIASSDTSKNELLRAMDLRLTALRRDLAAKLNQVTGFACLSKEINDLINFCEYFGAAYLKNALSKILAPNQNSETAVFLNDGKPIELSILKTDSLNKANGDDQVTRHVYTEPPIKYGVSPAMVAHIERQSSTESEESSKSSDENQVSANRSRAFTRSLPPRRSASPMRRIQIGRSGSRRATALTIKSLNNYPARERILSNRDASANSSEDEGSEQPGKKPENNFRVMTVQDAINLFESKQKDQKTVQRSCSSSNAYFCKSKSVLRRWSAGATECSTSCQPEVSGGSGPLCCNELCDVETSKDSVEKLESDISACQNFAENAVVDVEIERLKIGAAHDLVKIETGTNATQTQAEESDGRSVASGRQKEQELDKMVLKVVESQRVRTNEPRTSKTQNIASAQRGGFYNHYKEKRNEKLRGEHPGKKAEKAAQFKEMQQVLDQRKSEMSFTDKKDAHKKQSPSIPQKLLKVSSRPANPRSEGPKTAVPKVVLSKTSVLPASRKSWPSTSSTRVQGLSSSKSPAGPGPTRQKPKSTALLPPSVKVGSSQLYQKNVKRIHPENNRNCKDVKDKTQQTLRKGAKLKADAIAGDSSNTGLSNPSFYNKVTKKSSVVPLEAKPFLRKAPLEAKPFLRKGSGVSAGVRSGLNKTKCSFQNEESSINCHGIEETQHKEAAANACAQMSKCNDSDITSCNQYDAATDLETFVNGSQNVVETANFDEFDAEADESIKKEANVIAKIQSPEECLISSAAWVEIEEQGSLRTSDCDGTSQRASLGNIEPVGSPRVRLSLSQMLQEDSSEPDSTEWGNAENPPAAMNQKDAPKGLKRLLKFARKSKGEANITGWSSPSFFSEGEDDAEESRTLGKRNSDEKQKSNVDAREILSAPSNISNFNALGLHKLREVHGTPAASTIKGTRSFFSLSAFRGNKPNDTKFH